MYKHLYDCFRHWYHDDRGTIYFYSDPHFADPEMKYIRKNYIGDDEQVARINKVIGKYDTIIFLGDIGDPSFISKIRGYKVLIKGNHDSGSGNYIRTTMHYGFPVEPTEKEKIKINSLMKQGLKFERNYLNFQGKPYKQYSLDNHLFDEIYEGALMIAPNIILSHEPIDFPFAINIHGHDHSNWCNSKFNMCAENIDYTPVPIERIIKSGELKKVKDIHRNAIDCAIQRKAGK